MKKSLLRKSALLAPALFLTLGAATSCNSKEKNDDDELQAAVTLSTVAVKSFSLKSDSKVLNKLDSVFFSIDLDNGVIFNADSLPKGTKITRLIPVITFPLSMSEANLVISGGSEKNDTVNYLTNSTDSIDFSRNVSLNVTSLDGQYKYSYRIKVNVHQQDPDSVMWGDMAVSMLPSRMADPVAQKTVEFKNKITSLIKENDGTLTLSRTEDISSAVWSKTEISLPFSPDVESLESTEDMLFLLDESGNLLTSTDGTAWNQTGENWITTIGAYNGSMLGIKNTDSGLMHCHYPANASITDSSVDPEFPLTGRSSFLCIKSEWTPDPVGIFVGGVKPSGEFSSSTWAFDGSNWETINDGHTPAIKGASLVRYIEYRKLGAFNTKSYECWLMIGGVMNDGVYNRAIYLSPDNGVTWRKGSSLMQLPDFFPPVDGADAVVAATQYHADLSDAWTVKTGTRSLESWLKPEVDGNTVGWKCPFIYIAGGTLPNGKLSNSIWRGVLTRLTFQPII